MTVSSIFVDAVIKPVEIMVKDPAVLFTNVYVGFCSPSVVPLLTNLYAQTALTYGIYYSFFEVFPLVYPPMYGFNLGELGLTFLTIGVACIVGLVLFNGYLLLYLVPDVMKRGLRAPEHRLVPALFAVCTLPMGYFMFGTSVLHYVISVSPLLHLLPSVGGSFDPPLFDPSVCLDFLLTNFLQGWTARPAVHWIVSMIGVVILVASNFIIFQCIFVYLPLSYPQYAASLFAGNDLFRAAFAAGCVIFSRPMFINLGVGGGGVSLLAGFAVVGVAGMFALWKFGAQLRARSTFAVK
jgi:DHA1 family multidrug resistance protein-like MFS transporter